MLNFGNMVDIEGIKKLREETGCGVIEAKKALEDSPDFESAIEYLRKQGAKKAANKEGRVTGQGIVSSYIHATGRIGAVVSLGCETDFVARTEDFNKLALEMAMQISAMDPKNVDELLSQMYIRDNSQTVKSLIVELSAKVGENVVVKDFKRLEV